MEQARFLVGVGRVEAYVPAAQSVQGRHAVTFVIVLYWAPGQGMQDRFVVAEGVLETYVPGPQLLQFVQDVEPVVDV